MPITIREVALKQDLGAILSLEHSTFQADAFPATEFLYLKFRGSDTFLVAYEGKQLAGYISAYVEENRAYIASLAVDDRFRRQGIGKTLLDAVTERIRRKAGIEHMLLHVRKSNQGAIALYESAGFEITGIIPGYYPDEDGLLMTRSL